MWVTQHNLNDLKINYTDDPRFCCALNYPNVYHVHKRINLICSFVPCHTKLYTLVCHCSCSVFHNDMDMVSLRLGYHLYSYIQWKTLHLLVQIVALFHSLIHSVFTYGAILKKCEFLRKTNSDDDIDRDTKQCFLILKKLSHSNAFRILAYNLHFCVCVCVCGGGGGMAPK